MPKRRKVADTKNKNNLKNKIDALEKVGRQPKRHKSKNIRNEKVVENGRSNTVAVNLFACYTVGCNSAVSHLYSCQHMFCCKCIRNASELSLGAIETRRKRMLTQKKKESKKCIIDGCDDGVLALTIQQNLDV